MKIPLLNFFSFHANFFREFFSSIKYGEYMACVDMNENIVALTHKFGKQNYGNWLMVQWNPMHLTDSPQLLEQMPML